MPDTTTAEPPQSEHPHASSSIVPDPSDSNPVVRLSKWAGAISGIVGALAVLVTGIWQVGALLNDLKATRAELASLEGSFSSYKDEMKRRDEIQAEILVNLRIAVASVQAASVARATPRTAARPVNEDHPAQRAIFAPPQPPPVGTASTREHLIPDAATLIRNLPRLPAPLATPTPPSGPVLVSGTASESRARALEVHENETVDVALRRAAILQDQL